MGLRLINQHAPTPPDRVREPPPDFGYASPRASPEHGELPGSVCQHRGCVPARMYGFPSWHRCISEGPCAPFQTAVLTEFDLAFPTGVI
jgi:hypothetical protein